MFKIEDSLWILENLPIIIDFLLSQKKSLFGGHIDSIHTLVKKVMKDSINIKILVVKSIHKLAEFYLELGIEVRMDEEIHRKAQSPSYRIIIAQNFEEISRIFHLHQKGEKLLPAFLEILISSEEAKVVLPHLPTILPRILYGTEPASKNRLSIASNLRDIWSVLGTHQWRSQQVFLEIIPEIQFLLPNAECNDFFLDEFLKILKSGNRKIQELCVPAVCRLIMHNQSSVKRSKIWAQILELGRSNSCYNRVAFAMFVAGAFSFFSFSLLTAQGVLDVYLSLSKDKVDSVLLKFIQAAWEVWKCGEEGVQHKILEKLHVLAAHPRAELRRSTERALSYFGSQERLNMKYKFINLEREKNEEQMMQKEVREKEIHKTPKYEVPSGSPLNLPSIKNYCKKRLKNCIEMCNPPEGKRRLTARPKPKLNVEKKPSSISILSMPSPVPIPKHHSFRKAPGMQLRTIDSGHSTTHIKIKGTSFNPRRLLFKKT